jgi:hypothetical protein
LFLHHWVLGGREDLSQVALFDVALVFEVQVMPVEQRSPLDILGHHHHWFVFSQVELFGVEGVHAVPGLRQHRVGFLLFGSFGVPGSSITCSCSITSGFVFVLLVGFVLLAHSRFVLISRFVLL